MHSAGKESLGLIDPNITKIQKKWRENSRRNAGIGVFCLLLFCALISGNSMISLVGNEAIILWLILRTIRKPASEEDFLPMQILCAVCVFMFYMKDGRTLIFLSFLLSGICLAEWYHHWDGTRIILAAVLVPGVFEVFYYSHPGITILYAVLLCGVYFCLLFLLAALFGDKKAIVAFMVFLCVFSVICFNYRWYRFQFPPIGELRSVKTYFEVSDRYPIRIAELLPALVLPCVAFTVPFLLFHKEYRPGMKPWLGIVLFLCLIPCNLLLGMIGRTTFQARRHSWQDALRMSAADELEMVFISPDTGTDRAKVLSNEPDSWKSDDIQPNIVTVMCESYADIEKAYELVLSADPLGKYREIDGTNIRKGTAECSVYGGGTSISEFEYETGIPIASVSQSRNPFMGDVNSNVAFTADPLYRSYVLSFLHPFRAVGWNRPYVYEKLKYDNAVFLEDWGDAEEYRVFVSDKNIYDRIKTILNEGTDPQWIMAVTIQNHGGYDDAEEKESTEIRVLNETEEKEAFEVYLSAINRSSADLEGFIKELDSMNNEPTLFIFFGDHFPSGLPELSEDREEMAFRTPYLVYSNYCDLSDIPDAISVSELLPYAKKAAGLPLSSWEKYVISGNEIDRDMAIGRLKEGYY